MFILGIYSRDTGILWWLLPPGPLGNFSPSGDDAILVPGIVQDVALHERFPCWCWPVISFLVHSKNVVSLTTGFSPRSTTMSRVSTRPRRQAVMFLNTQSCCQGMVWSERERERERERLLHFCTRCYLNILSAKRFCIETCLHHDKHKPHPGIKTTSRGQTTERSSCLETSISTVSKQLCCFFFFFNGS